MILAGLIVVPVAQEAEKIVAALLAVQDCHVVLMINAILLVAPACMKIVLLFFPAVLL